MSASASTGSASPAGTPTASTKPPRRTGPPGPPTRSLNFLTVADDGTAIQVRTGQLISVLLGPGGPMWDQPTAAGAAVVRVSAGGGYPTSLPAHAIFKAVQPGTAQLTSATDSKCLHASPRCMIPQRVWHVTVHVVAG